MILLVCTKRGQAIVARLVALVAGLSRIRCQIKEEEEEEVAPGATEAMGAIEMDKREAIEMELRGAIEMENKKKKPEPAEGKKEEAAEVAESEVDDEEAMETLKLTRPEV